MTKKSILFSAVPILLLSSSIAHAAPPAEPTRVEIMAKRFSFEPNQVTLKEGQHVVIVLKSADVAHGLRIRELGLNIKAGKGQTAEVPFTPTKAGDFTGRCSVFCGSGHGKMTFVMHVTE